VMAVSKQVGRRTSMLHGRAGGRVSEQILHRT
jgi:hypothetical protein